MTIGEKVAYIKGLAEGQGVDDSTKEGKIIHLLIETMADIADAVDDLENQTDGLEDEVSALVEDVEMIAEDVYSDDFEDDCDCDCDGECDCDEDLYYEVECPTCGEKICIDEDMLDNGEIACPACGENLEFDLSDLDIQEEDPEEE